MRFSFFALLTLVPPTVSAQTAVVSLAGTWKAETPEGPRAVVIRADSSASYGDETVRWRVAGDSIHIAFGDEWMVYGFTMRGARLTLSGGDLDEPITLRRAGPATPRPDSIPLPPAPPATRRSNGGTIHPTTAAPARRTKVLACMDVRAGAEFEPDVTRQFVRMMRERENKVAVVTEDEAVPV